MPPDHAAPVPDGAYDALVIDAEETGDGALLLSLTIVSGPQKGEVLDLRGDPASTGGGDPVELLGLPATITVAGGVPSVALEP